MWLPEQTGIGFISSAPASSSEGGRVSSSLRSSDGLADPRRHLSAAEGTGACSSGAGAESNRRALAQKEVDQRFDGWIVKRKGRGKRHRQTSFQPPLELHRHQGIHAHVEEPLFQLDLPARGRIPECCWFASAGARSKYRGGVRVKRFAAEGRSPSAAAVDFAGALVVVLGSRPGLHFSKQRPRSARFVDSRQCVPVDSMRRRPKIDSLNKRCSSAANAWALGIG